MMPFVSLAACVAAHKEIDRRRRRLRRWGDGSRGPRLKTAKIIIAARAEERRCKRQRT